jgi:hypothetical protein
MVDRFPAGSDAAAFSVVSASRCDSLVIPAALRALISLRLAALSLWRSNRRISFWRFLKVSMVVSSSQADSERRDRQGWTAAALKGFGYQRGSRR